MLKARYAAGLVAAAAFVGGGVAWANHGSQSTQTAAADFTASSVSQIHSNTCVGSDGAYQDTTATYTGTATSSDPRLSGPIEIRAHSVVNTTKNLGWLDGTVRVRGTSAGSYATFRGAITNGTVVGLANGHGDNGGGGKLVATFVSAFSQSAGFTSGHLGSGTATNAGVFFTQGSCSQMKQVKSTFIFKLHLRTNEVVPPVHDLRASADGSLTLDVTRDSSGNVLSGNVVFYVNYGFPGAVTITDLSVNQAARGANGPAVIDAGTGSIVDPDGHGNLTKVVSTVSPTVLTNLLANPRGYYVTLATSANPSGALRDQLDNPERR
jgi:hypothetical protein